MPDGDTDAADRDRQALQPATGESHAEEGIVEDQVGSLFAGVGVMCRVSWTLFSEISTE